ncbi:hypothetical protein HPB49_017140 [Dermacentor silvarum]|uniref:Uncharacterized protein n=1 Tax=Dermacentor silvarum TaxID=543639 RepID=A0ACB8CS54_DERSI|nr:hypothetical protein HPB49_017140 [Dermacentor silvarum]
MASALRNTDADKTHQSSTEASEDEDMEIRESQGPLPAAEENEEDSEPWINVTSRARRRRLQTRSTTPQLSQTPPKPVLRQSRPVMRKPRQPPLPADDYKLAVRPRNILQLNKVSPGKLVDAITNEAKLQIGYTGFKIRIDEDQNILVLSTASEATASALSKMQKITIGATTYDIASYGISPDNSCKGVIYNIDHDTTPEMLLKRIESPGYEALTCRRLGNTTTMVITFLGKTVPYYIEFSGLLLRCYLYKRTVPHCRTCNETGHREDVCPRPPATPKCRECGTSLATEQHECHPRCSLCGGNHPTAAKTCPNRFLPPVNRRKPQQALRAGSSSPTPRGERSASRKSRSPKRCGAVLERSSSRPRSGSRRRTSSRRRTPSHGRTSSRGRSASGRRGSKGAAQVTQQVSWAQVVSPKARPPPPVDTELAQAHAHIRRLTEENATLKAEISKVHAEFVALKDELLGRNSTTPTQSTSTPPPEKRKREEQPAHTVTSNPTPQRATAQPTTPQGVIPVQYATPQKVEEIVAKAIQSLQTSLQATMQQQLTAIQQSAAQQQQFATQQQHSNTEMAERIMRLEERILALEARQSRRPKKAAHQALPDLSDSLGSPEPHLVRASPPLNNQDGSSSTYMQ